MLASELLRNVGVMSAVKSSDAWANRPARADHRARNQRDAALERVGTITKAIGVASVAAVAVIGIYVSRALPGHSATPTSTGAGTVSGSAAAGGQAGGSQAVQPNSLSQPNNPPAQSQQQAPVVSGST